MKHTFERYSPAMERTYALKNFNECETEINEHFWSFKVVSEYAAYLARDEKKNNPESPTAKLFKAIGPDSGRIPPTVAQWLTARSELENWLRLGALASASSYLEIYFGQVIRSALMSAPLCKLGSSSRTLDGITLLKQGIELPYEHEIRSVTKGEWSQRSKAFCSIFGDVPSELTTHLITLEKIRKIRNSFAHGFGRELDIPSPIDFIGKSSRLSQPKFIKYMGVISKTAAAIDKYLLHGFIGNFEIIYFYHIWRKNTFSDERKKYSDSRALQRVLNRDMKFVTNEQFCKKLIAYYDVI